MTSATIERIEHHLQKARNKHAELTAKNLHEVGVLAGEEFGEFCKELNEYYYAGNMEMEQEHLDKAVVEAFDLIAVLIRFVEEVA